MRTAGIGARTAAVDDAIGPLPADFLRAQIEAKPFAHHTGEEAADGVLLPMGRAHDGSNRRSLRSAQHREHASLLRARSAIAPQASFGLRLARVMLLARGLLCCNGTPLAGGSGFGRRCFDFGGAGAGAASSSRSIASRPGLVMRSASAPLSASRRRICSR